MIALRLFTASDPSRQLDMRVLDDRDELTIGRDAAAGWALPDPDRALSRLHLKVGVRGGAVSVTDTSTNGVTLATREARMPRDESVRVDLGERLEFGPYVVLIERADANARPEPAASPTAANPFLRGGEPEAAPRGAPPDPFASALPADPLSRRADPFTSSGGGGGARTGYDAPAGGDAWAGKREQRAGDWDAPAERPAPEAMIGSTPSWNEPEPIRAEGGGFGFDAPFTRPVLQAPAVASSDLAIPSDWDAPAKPAAPDVKARPAIAKPLPDGPLADGLLAAEPLAAERISAEPTPYEPAAADPFAPEPPPPEPISPPPRAKAKPRREPAAAPAPALPPAASRGGGDLMAAFCKGARLDPAAFASSDPAEVMERAWARSTATWCWGWAT